MVTTELSGTDRPSHGTRPGSKRKVLMVFAVLFGFTFLAAGAFLWMAKEGLERSGAGDYSGIEVILGEDDPVQGVRPR